MSTDTTEWYSRSEADRLVTEYMDSTVHVVDFWHKHLNLAFEKGRQIGAGESMSAEDKNELAYYRRLRAAGGVSND